MRPIRKGAEGQRGKGALALALLLFSFSPLPLFQAHAAITGNTNVIGAWIEPQGDAFDFQIGGDASTFYGTNWQFFNGFQTSPATNFTAVTGTQTCTLTVGSFGWQNGVNIAKTRTLYVTDLRRKPYPSQDTNWVYAEDAANQTNTIGRVAISDYVYAGETLTLNTTDAFIINTNSGVHAARVTELTVTNLSALTFQNDSEPSINWAHPGQQRWTNAIEYVFLDGGHWSGLDGIRVEATEGVNTQAVEAAHIAWRITEAGRLHGLYVAAIPTGTFSNFASVRIDYIARPNIGTNVFDTRLDRWTGLTPFPSSQTNFWDRFNVFTNFGIVTVGGGSSPTITNGPPENVHPDNYFPTIDGAFAALVLTNRNNIGISNAIGRVLARSSVSNMMNGTATAGPVPPSWAILQNYPGDTVVFTNITGDLDVSDCWKIEGDTTGGGSLTIAMTGAATFNGIARLWLANLTINSPTTQLFGACTNTTLTDVTIAQLGQGLVAISSQNTSFALLRDIDVSGINGNIHIRTAIGLRRRTAANPSFKIISTRDPGSGGAPFTAHTIFTDSEFYTLGASGSITPIQFGNNTSGGPLLSAPTNDMLHGSWVENILFEGTNSPSSIAVSYFAEGNTTNTVFKNITGRGVRGFGFYNTTNWFRTTPRVYNSIFYGMGWAADLPGGGPGETLTNNINWLHQVGSSGNVYSFPVGSTSHGWTDFDGINNIMPGTSGGKLSTNFLRFQREASYINGAAPGSGDYALTSDNFLFDMGGNGHLPTHYTGPSFDGDGNPWSPVSGPGHRVGGQVIMAGVGFF